MIDKGNLSFGHALFRLRKSIQHWIWPFFFFTRTMLDGKSFKVLDRLEKSCYQQLLDFLSDLSLYLSVENPGWLEYLLSSQIYIETMDH